MQLVRLAIIGTGHHSEFDPSHWAVRAGAVNAGTWKFDFPSAAPFTYSGLRLDDGSLVVLHRSSEYSDNRRVFVTPEELETLPRAELISVPEYTPGSSIQRLPDGRVIRTIYGRLVDVPSATPA